MIYNYIYIGTPHPFIHKDLVMPPEQREKLKQKQKNYQKKEKIKSTYPSIELSKRLKDGSFIPGVNSSSEFGGSGRNIAG